MQVFRFELHNALRRHYIQGGETKRLYICTILWSSLTLEADEQANKASEAEYVGDDETVDLGHANDVTKGNLNGTEEL